MIRAQRLVCCRVGILAAVAFWFSARPAPARADPIADTFVPPLGGPTDGYQIGAAITMGSTDHDANDLALRAVLAEWASNRSLQERIANLTDGSGTPDRLNRGAFLNPSTLTDDGVIDRLFGNSRRDRMLGSPGDRVIDRSPKR